MNEKKDAQIKLMFDETLKNIETIKYGEVVLSLRIHDGRISSITQSVTKNTIYKGWKD
jgi:hypothetical protein